MPEMLEVERYRRVADAVVGRTISDVWLVDDRYGRRGTDTRSVTSMIGASVTGTRRIGKLLLVDTTAGTIGLRFGMTGGLVVDGVVAIDRLEYGPGHFEDKWVRATIGFEGGGLLQMHDPRRFGSVELDPDETELGPDAATITRAQLDRALNGLATRRRSAPLKARLMDQSALAGIGNLICDELLWEVGFSPLRTDAIAGEDLMALHNALRKVLRRLDRRGGSHTGDLMAQRTTQGHCPRDGAELRREQVGGRTTYWCPRHQH